MYFAKSKHLSMLRSVCSHISNLFDGVNSKFEYKMRLVYSHFPINANITNGGKTVELRNFLGEKIVRTVSSLATHSAPVSRSKNSLEWESRIPGSRNSWASRCPGEFHPSTSKNRLGSNSQISGFSSNWACATQFLTQPFRPLWAQPLELLRGVGATAYESKGRATAMILMKQMKPKEHTNKAAANIQRPKW